MSGRFAGLLSLVAALLPAALGLADATATHQGDIFILENQHMRVEVDAAAGARIRSWRLKPSGREMIALWKGAGEIGGALDDRGFFTSARYDASVTQPGPGAAVLRFEARHSSGLGVVRQMTLPDDSPALRVNWEWRNGTQTPQRLFVRNFLLPGTQPQTEQHLYWVNAAEGPVAAEPTAASRTPEVHRDPLQPCVAPPVRSARAHPVEVEPVAVDAPLHGPARVDGHVQHLGGHGLGVQPLRGGPAQPVAGHADAVVPPGDAVGDLLDRRVDEHPGTQRRRVRDVEPHDSAVDHRQQLVGAPAQARLVPAAVEVLAELRGPTLPCRGEHLGEGGTGDRQVPAAVQQAPVLEVHVEPAVAHDQRAGPDVDGPWPGGVVLLEPRGDDPAEVAERGALVVGDRHAEERVVVPGVAPAERLAVVDEQQRAAVGVVVGPSNPAAIVLYAVAAVMAVTSLVGSCPLYTVLGMKTCPVSRSRDGAGAS